MSKDDMICVQIAPNGKWHAYADGKTVCGLDLPPVTSPPEKPATAYRYLYMVDSRDRCLSDQCKEARLKHAGLA